MNYKQTPPIQWLPVFEAAATELSFKKAAEQMHVTPPAVGQQIKALEDWLGVPLFERRPRSLTLTPEGEHYLSVAREVLQAHKRGYMEFKRRFQNSSFNISTSLFIAQEVLIPNYLSFADFYPDTELRIEARMSLADFDSDTIDAAIRFGAGQWPATQARKLCDVKVAPVCSPDYLKENPITDIQNLDQHRLIYSSAQLEEWHFLLGDKPHQKLVCDSYMAAMKAASEGVGIALGIFPVSNNWLNKGLLTMPFPALVPTPYGYWVCTPEQRSHPASEAFYDWAKQLFDQLPMLDNEPTL